MGSGLQRILLVIVAALLILLCAAIALTYWLVGPSLRCEMPSEGPALPGWSARTVTSGGLERCYYLYAPPDYDPAQAEPVVFSFHGFLSNPISHALITRWHSLADQEGFLVVYPQGTSFPQHWDAGETWGVSAAGLTNAPSYFLGADDWTATWAESSRCDPAPETIPPQGDVHGTRYTGCEQDASVVLYTIDRGGHAWPGGMPIPFMGKTTADIDATEELWKFFQAYTLDD